MHSLSGLKWLIRWCQNIDILSKYSENWFFQGWINCFFNIFANLRKILKNYLWDIHMKRKARLCLYCVQNWNAVLWWTQTSKLQFGTITNKQGDSNVWTCRIMSSENGVFAYGKRILLSNGVTVWPQVFSFQPVATKLPLFAWFFFTILQLYKKVSKSKQCSDSFSISL